MLTKTFIFTGLLALLLLLLVLFLFSTHPARNDGMTFAWPVDCLRGENCWVVHYPDADAAKDAGKDFRCGTLTNDGHDGTDIAVRDIRVMEGGVDILAVADGTVLRGRDIMEDDANLKAAKDLGQECGNGMVIAHAGGWETQYCHMKKGSIAVAPGQTVKKGQRLGQVGQSGMAQFPHLHLTVRRDGKVIDPFTGAPHETACTAAPVDGATRTAALWDKPAPYDPVMFYAAGFSDAEPVYDALTKDAAGPETLPLDSPVLAFWFFLYGAQEGDRIALEIRDPDGKPYAQATHAQPKNQIRVMRFIGKSTANAPLKAGTYTGTATLVRTQADGQELRRVVERAVVVP